jgi:hypothetical protein
MNRKIRSFGSTLLVIFAAASLRSEASDLVVGGHIGASKYSNLIYGANLTVHPYDLYGLRVDATFGDGFVSSSPAFIFYPVAYEEMSFGLMGGPGLVKVTGADPRFSLHLGVLGSVKLGSSLEAGLDARYIFPINGESGFMIFANLGFVFNVGDSW